MGSFSCYLIGADSLLMECGEILSARGHHMLGIITDAPRLTDWARQRGLATIPIRSDYPTLLKSTTFDYLFSITHLGVLPGEVIRLPRRGAINFHDGPLPRYAGLNTPVWALLHRETSYGITWHLMTERVDEGDILKQRVFDLSPSETALSLNTRCFEAGIDSFAELVDELAAGTVTPRRQDLTHHRMFSRHERPPAACVLDWSQPAEELEALVRALDFGRYDNPVGSAKVLLVDEPYIVTRAIAAHESTTAAPGTIVALEPDRIRVATGKGVLSILGLSNLFGREAAVHEVAKNLELRVGQPLGGLSARQREALTKLNAELSRSEAFWIRRLAALEPIELANARTDGCPCAAPAMMKIPLTVPADFGKGLSAQDWGSALATAFAYFVARLGQKNEFDLAFVDPHLCERCSEQATWINSQTCLHVQVKNALPFDEARAEFAKELSIVRHKGPWLKDLVARHAEIRARLGANPATALPVRIEFMGEGKVADSGALVDSSALSRSLIVLMISETRREAFLRYDIAAYSADAAAALARQFLNYLTSVAANPARAMGEHDLLSEFERRRMLVDWNRTETPYPRNACVHQLIEAQAGRTPDAPAVVFEDQTLTYRELNDRADRLANHLRTLGVGPDVLVGLFVERSLDLAVGALGILKAGGAYVPLDPAFPRDRLAFMLEDSQAPVIVAQNHLLADAPKSNARVVRIDADRAQIAGAPKPASPSPVTSSNLAYVIYTSGSTGKPKGVMVEHRNVVNFFAGMDANIPHETPGAWLAVTTLSFDISVLELFWTLARGFKVVLYLDRDRTQSTATAKTSSVNRAIDFSLFLWGNDDGPGSRKYDLLLEAAKFGDTHGFSAVWTPERHFHAFGGPYPNPSVLGAAVATITRNLQIRAGSCVLPLHHPIRVAEEWAVVDNLSNGRVGVSFASGWQPHDFVLRPEAYKDNKTVLFREIETVRRLWRGESVEFPGPLGDMVPRTTLPRPVQKELPIWITSAGNPETYRQAGAIGANILTHLLGQSVMEVAEKIKIYREARAAHGHDPETGIVTLMLHTFVGENEEEVRRIVKEPMKEYLRSSVNLIRQFAWTFPAFKRPQGSQGKPEDVDLDGLSPEELDGILDYAFLRYYESSGLFGTPESCVAMVDRLKQIGVDDIACLIDFGVDTKTMLANLVHLDRLRSMTSSANVQIAASSAKQDQSFAAQVKRHCVTHMQCTPSMARMLLTNDETRAALASIRHLFIGGEAFPSALARDLQALGASVVTNMYGPTETTVWSTTHLLNGEVNVPIGRPIANTRIYILDASGRPVPPGVPGELFIGGDGVVRGYFKRPELTAERFVADPFAGVAGARMYRTGDLARFRDDGVIEFLGRNDFQVKIRGYRIELGEIEARLAAHDSVREAVVMVREDVPGDPRLVAYVIASNGTVSPPELRDSLRRHLPDYMVPAHFVVLDRFPQTPNGKVDRKALPAPQARDARPSTPSAAPTDELEKTIANLWKETLGVESVSVDDNFFDIGGHSLLVVRIHRRLKETVETPVALTDLYRFPTIRSFAEFLRSGGVDGRIQQSTDRAELRRASLQRRRAVHG